MAIKKVIVFNYGVTDLFNIQPDIQMKQSELVDAVVDYAVRNNGMTANAFNYDATMWRVLDMNSSVKITLENLLYYMAKFYEDVPSEFTR